MSDGLEDTLGRVRRRLELGLHEAERELARTRARCVKLDLTIRSIRAKPPSVDPSTSQERLVILESAIEESGTETPEIVTRAAGIVLPDTSRRALRPRLSGATVPNAYMPILEELWDIAKHSDPD